MRLNEIPNPIRGLRRAAVLALTGAMAMAVCGIAAASATHVDAAVAASGDPHTVPAREMVKYVVNKVPPVYPPDAKKARIQGKVVLDALIGKDGTVEHLKVLSGPKELQQSSLDAVRQWTYKPFLVNGEPVEVETTVNIIYTLAK